MEFSIEHIQDMIFIVLGQKVMLDSDLAKLYGVETSALNRQVRRNSIRFPSDFMFQLSTEEHEELRCQIGISKNRKGGRRYNPLVFTESGIAMLSSVLKTEEAALVNISIMRIFIKLRSYYMMEKELLKEFKQYRNDSNKLFKAVFERLDNLEDGLPNLSNNRKKIGLKTKK